VFRTLRRVIGESVTSAVGLEAFTAGNTFRTWPLLHKVANFASDAVINDRSNFAALNAWVSRDPVTINRKFRESVTVVPKAVLFFASNAEPVANDPSDAFWRRLRLVKCLHQVDEKDVNPRLSEELFEEAPGILNKVLASLPVIERAKAIVMPEAVRQNVFELRTRVGSFREFASEELERGTEKDFVYRDDTISQYRGWALQKNLVVEDLRRIRSEMERLFGSRGYGNGITSHLPAMTMSPSTSRRPQLLPARLRITPVLSPGSRLATENRRRQSHQSQVWRKHRVRRPSMMMTTRTLRSSCGGSTMTRTIRARELAVAC
jgi:hypothetical protein